MYDLTVSCAHLTRPCWLHTAVARSVIASVVVLEHRQTQDSFKLMSLGSASDIANHPSTSLIS